MTRGDVRRHRRGHPRRIRRHKPCTRRSCHYCGAGGESPLDRRARERATSCGNGRGKSNKGIAEALVVTQAAVEKHVTSIFHKLELDPAGTEHRRVLAVLTYMSTRTASH